MYVDDFIFHSHQTLKPACICYLAEVVLKILATGGDKVEIVILFFYWTSSCHFQFMLDSMKYVIINTSEGTQSQGPPVQGAKLLTFLNLLLHFMHLLMPLFAVEYGF